MGTEAGPLERRVAIDPATRPKACSKASSTEGAHVALSQDLSAGGELGTRSVRRSYRTSSAAVAMMREISRPRGRAFAAQQFPTLRPPVAWHLSIQQVAQFSRRISTDKTVTFVVQRGEIVHRRPRGPASRQIVAVARREKDALYEHSGFVIEKTPPSTLTATQAHHCGWLRRQDRFSAAAGSSCASYQNRPGLEHRYAGRVVGDGTGHSGRDSRCRCRRARRRLAGNEAAWVTPRPERGRRAGALRPEGLVEFVGVSEKTRSMSGIAKCRVEMPLSCRRTAGG